MILFYILLFVFYLNVKLNKNVPKTKKNISKIRQKIKIISIVKINTSRNACIL